MHNRSPLRQLHHLPRSISDDSDRSGAVKTAEFQPMLSASLSDSDAALHEHTMTEEIGVNVNGDVKRDGPYIPHVQSDLESDEFAGVGGGGGGGASSPQQQRIGSLNGHGTHLGNHGSGHLSGLGSGLGSGHGHPEHEDGSPSKDPRRRQRGLFGWWSALLRGGGPQHGQQQQRRSGSPGSGPIGSSRGSVGNQSPLCAIMTALAVIGTITYAVGYRNGLKKRAAVTAPSWVPPSSSRWFGTDQPQSYDPNSNAFVNEGKGNGNLLGIGPTLRPPPRSRSHKPRAFVCITGQLSRLELENKIRNLFKPWHALHAVEFDVALVLSDTAHTSVRRQGQRDQEFFTTLEVYDALNVLPGVTVLNTDLDMQTQHPVLNKAYMDQRNFTGNMNISQLVERVQNHVRQFESLARCHYHMVSSGRNYDIVHRVREDVGYYTEVDFDHQMRVVSEHPMTVASSDCEVHGGINDRGSFVSPEASYDYFNHPILHMYMKPLPTDVRNTEQFLMVTYGRTCHLVETDSFHLFRLWEHTNGTVDFSESDVKCIAKKHIGEKSTKPLHMRRELCREMADGHKYCIQYDKKFRTYIPKDYDGTEEIEFAKDHNVGNGKPENVGEEGSGASSEGEDDDNDAKDDNSRYSSNVDGGDKKKAGKREEGKRGGESAGKQPGHHKDGEKDNHHHHKDKDGDEDARRRLRRLQQQQRQQKQQQLLWWEKVWRLDWLPTDVLRPR